MAQAGNRARNVKPRSCRTVDVASVWASPHELGPARRHLQPQFGDNTAKRAYACQHEASSSVMQTTGTAHRTVTAQHCHRTVTVTTNQHEASSSVTQTTGHGTAALWWRRWLKRGLKNKTKYLPSRCTFSSPSPVGAAQMCSIPPLLRYFLWRGDRTQEHNGTRSRWLSSKKDRGVKRHRMSVS